LVTNEELMLRRPDGSRIPVSCNSGPVLDRSGAVTGAVMAWRDITERKRAERALLDANQRKDEFIALMAHELRNPLAPIVNALPIVRQSEQADARQNALEIIEKQVWQMVHLIDDLLDVSRITRGKIRLRKTTVDLAMVLESSVTSARPHIAARKHSFNVKFPDNPLYVDADPTRLTQVIANLLNNAAKYTPERGQISLQVDRVANEAWVRVRDNGIGIAEEAFPRLFEMFSQIDERKEAASGLGLGLALAKQLTEMHGGSIDVTSAVGRGSEFVVRLPLMRADAARSQHVAPPTSRHTALTEDRILRVLVVDDSEPSARSLAGMLELFGHRAHLAYDGPTALELFDSASPHVALLDIGMPEMNGYELARALRARAPAGELLLVAVTGWGTNADRERARRAGFDHHFVKPANPQELQALLDKHHRLLFPS
jgi:signal transduction histidine kinase/ActR/RegA family two-component response regulator